MLGVFLVIATTKVVGYMPTSKAIYNIIWQNSNMSHYIKH